MSHVNSSKIAVVGDSHSLMLGGVRDFRNPTSIIKDTDCYWLGPAKIWGLRNKTVCPTGDLINSTLDKLATYDYVVFSLGEIDVRVNSLSGYIKYGIDYFSNLANTYVGYIDSLPLRRKIILCPSPTSPYSQQNLLNVPFVGCSQTRNSLTHLLTKSVLKAASNTKTVLCTSIFYDIVDSSLIASADNYLDGLHLDPIKVINIARSRLADCIRTQASCFNTERFESVSDPNFYINPCEDLRGDHMELKLIEWKDKDFLYFIKWAKTSRNLNSETSVVFRPSLGIDKALQIKSLLHPSALLDLYLNNLPFAHFVQLARPFFETKDYRTGKSLVSKLANKDSINQLLNDRLNISILFNQFDNL